MCIVVSTPAYHAADRGSKLRIPLGPGVIIMCKNLALYIRDCVSVCLSDETLKAIGPYLLVSMPGEVNYPTSLHCMEMCNPRGT